MTQRRLGFAVVALVVWSSLPALAGEKDEAKQLFEAGLGLMKLEDFAGATADFERSVALFPTQHSLFNLANCYRALRRYGDALDTLKRLQRDFGKGLTSEIQAATSRQESEIRALIARLTVHVLPPDAVVTVDGIDAGSGSTRGPWVLAPGEHSLEVSRPGYRPQQRRLQLVSGKETEESVELAPLSAALAGPAPSASPSTPPVSLNRVDLTATPQSDATRAPPVYKRWWFWAAGAAVAIGAGVGIYVAAASNSGPSAKLGIREAF